MNNTNSPVLLDAIFCHPKGIHLERRAVMYFTPMSLYTVVFLDDKEQSDLFPKIKKSVSSNEFLYSSAETPLDFDLFYMRTFEIKPKDSLQIGLGGMHYLYAMKPSSSAVSLNLTSYTDKGFPNFALSTSGQLIQPCALSDFDFAPAINAFATSEFREVCMRDRHFSYAGYTSLVQAKYVKAQEVFKTTRMDKHMYISPIMHTIMPSDKILTADEIAYLSVSVNTNLGWETHLWFENSEQATALNADTLCADLRERAHEGAVPMIRVRYILDALNETQQANYTRLKSQNPTLANMYARLAVVNENGGVYRDQRVELIQSLNHYNRSFYFYAAMNQQSHGLPSMALFGGASTSSGLMLAMQLIEGIDVSGLTLSAEACVNTILADCTVSERYDQDPKDIICGYKFCPVVTDRRTYLAHDARYLADVISVYHVPDAGV